MKKTLGLGRGLDALIDTTHVSTAGSSSISEIPLQYIYANPDQPRHDFDAEALVSTTFALLVVEMLISRIINQIIYL